MKGPFARRAVLPTLAFILSLLPFAVDGIYFVIMSLNADHWGFIILALMVLPSVHTLLGIAGLVCGIVSCVKRKMKVRTVVAIVIAVLDMVIGIACLWPFIG